MVLALYSPSFVLFDDLRREMTELDDGKHLLEKIDKGEATDKWTTVNNLTIYSERIFMSTTSSLWLAILATAHEAGYEGVHKTLHRLLPSFYNANTTKLIKDYVKSCVVCQSEDLNPAGLLQPLELPSLVWADFVKEFMESSFA
jgi:hypothetical protein